jgi:hypothetical protein
VNKDRKVYLVGQITGGYFNVSKNEWAPNTSSCEIIGVFTNKQLAEEACIDSDTFVMPVKINTVGQADETYLPLRKE